MSVLKRKDSGIWEVVGGGEAPPITLGYAEVTTNQTGITTEVDLTGLSVTVTVPAGRRIRVTGYVPVVSSTVANDVGQLRLKEGATLLQLNQALIWTNGAGNQGRHVVTVLTPSAGTHTYKLSGIRTVGTGSLTFAADPTFPAFILVEDITGGSGAPSGPYGSTRAYRATSNVTLTHQTHTAIPLNAEEFDDDTLHDNSTNPSRFTIAATGRYELVGQIQYATTSATGTRHAVIWKNGTGTGTRIAAANIPGQTSTNPRVQVSTGIINLTAGDYVELGGWQDSTANLDVSFGADLTWLSLRRIS